MSIPNPYEPPTMSDDANDGHKASVAIKLYVAEKSLATIRTVAKLASIYFACSAVVILIQFHTISALVPVWDWTWRLSIGVLNLGQSIVFGVLAVSMWKWSEAIPLTSLASRRVCAATVESSAEIAVYLGMSILIKFVTFVVKSFFWVYIN